ncbi:MAG: polyprenyl synthetase family protein, partial [Nocardioides sp.]
PAGDDLVEGKRTVLVALALDGAAGADAALLDRSLGTALDAPAVTRLREIIDGSGAHAQVEGAIGDLAARSRAALDEAHLDDDARAVLRSLAAAVTDRTG